MRTILFVLLWCAILSAQTAPKPVAPVKSPVVAATPSDKVVLTVGEEKMTAAQFDEFVDSLPEQYKMAAKGPGKRQVVEQLVSLKTLAQEARKRKLDQKPAFQSQLAFQTENLLAGTLFRELSTSLK